MKNELLRIEITEEMYKKAYQIVQTYWLQKIQQKYSLTSHAKKWGNKYN